MRHELFDVIGSDEIRQGSHCKAKVSGSPNKYIVQATVGRELRKRKETLTSFYQT